MEVQELMFRPSRAKPDSEVFLNGKSIDSIEILIFDNTEQVDLHGK